jgi:regulator of sigma E protease
MFTELLSGFWSVILVVVFFGGSILVHELGHFWAARWRGVKVERFSIGFGPRIFSWRGKDGVEYCLSWLPLGGYVALPQLADMSAIEGTADPAAPKLPEPGYLTKMIVFVAGATMNVLFAFLLAIVVWQKGVPVGEDSATTRIGYVAPTIELSDKSTVESPAAKAGLRVGDTIRKIDDVEIEAWYDVLLTLMTSSGTTADGRPKAELTIERDGKLLQVTVYPQISGQDRDRKIGISQGYELIVHSFAPGSEAEKAGFLPGDRILRTGDTLILGFPTWKELTESHTRTPLPVTISRNGVEKVLTLPPLTDLKAAHGLNFTVDVRMTHPSPYKQVADNVRQTFRIIRSLLSSSSNVGLDKVSGPIGIVNIFHRAATAGLLPLLSFTILVNISLAIFNLLPIPVLDGGHMLFATIAKLRGRPLPARLVMGAQSVFMVLLLMMIVYVSTKDVQRLRRDNTPEKPSEPAAGAPAKPASETAPAATPPPSPKPTPAPETKPGK